MLTLMMLRLPAGTGASRNPVPADPGVALRGPDL